MTTTTSPATADGRPVGHGPRGHRGRFLPTIATATRDAEAARLAEGGMSYRAIGRELGCSPTTAHQAARRALTAIRTRRRSDECVCPCTCSPDPEEPPQGCPPDQP